MGCCVDADPGRSCLASDLGLSVQTQGAYFNAPFPEAGARYGIRGIPLLLAFRSGREIGCRAGATPAGEIANWVGARAQT